jgi:hypothetical protein
MASQKSGDSSRGFSATLPNRLLRRLVISFQGYQPPGYGRMNLSTLCADTVEVLP